ncbi:hypothetical protein [Neisseria yangbaofengii]|uniref:hypothetical protein n=1 Tax=Neisseria yangbaofengii TaxID=2709396 RepID=UPI0013EAA451|nr:hypothetical protein [Neisseria yangbaofengii]
MRLPLALPLICALPALAAEPHIHRQVYPLSVADRVHITRYCHPEATGVFLFHPHDNEYTAKQVALEAVRRYPVCLIALEHRGTRRISFRSGESYADFDPNRIYSPQGRAATLSGGLDEAAAHSAAAFADAVLNALKPAGFIIALHNNTDGATNIESYALEPLAGTDAPVFVQPQHDEDDYFYVNGSRAFAFFKSRGFNVVQQTDNVADDGSLSVYAAKHGIGYINIEAEYGHEAEQRNMLQAAWEYWQSLR